MDRGRFKEEAVPTGEVGPAIGSPQDDKSPIRFFLVDASAGEEESESQGLNNLLIKHIVQPSLAFNEIGAPFAEKAFVLDLADGGNRGLGVKIIQIFREGLLTELVEIDIRDVEGGEVEREDPSGIKAHGLL